MKHIAIISSGLFGITYASFELANRLISEGYKITFLSPIDIREKVEENGFDYVQLPEINFNLSIKHHLIPDSKKKNPILTYFYYLTNSKKVLIEGIKKLKFDEYESIFKKVDPDLALIDLEIHEAVLTCQKLKIKTKLLSQHLLDRRQKYLPSITTKLIPKQGFKGSFLGIELSWLYIKTGVFARSLAHKLLLRDNRKSILLHYKKINNLNHLEMVSRSFPSDLIYTKMDMLYLVYPELEFPFKKPENIYYLGAMVNSKKEDSNVSDKLKKIVAIKNDEDKNLLYCSITTMKNIGDLNFIKKLIKAVSQRNDWILVVSTGRAITEEQYFENLPENVHIFSWVPQLYILKHCDCSINHGGIHTINECLHYKVPMLVYSGKKYDQDGCAARIFYHSLGLRGDKDKDDALAIEYKIDKLLTDKSILKNLDNIKLVVDKYKKIPITPYLFN